MDVATGADDVRMLVAGRVDVVILRVELVAGTLGIGVDAEDAHRPRRGLQPVPQWSALEPHQPYLCKLGQLHGLGEKKKEIDLLRATLALKVAGTCVAFFTTTRTILGHPVGGAGGWKNGPSAGSWPSRPTDG